MSGRGKAPHDQRPNKVSASAANSIAGRGSSRAYGPEADPGRGTAMSGVAASPSAGGSAGSETPASAGAPKQLFEAAYKYALVATRSRAPADGGALAICMPSTGGARREARWARLSFRRRGPPDRHSLRGTQPTQPDPTQHGSSRPPREMTQPEGSRGRAGPAARRSAARHGDRAAPKGLRLQYGRRHSKHSCISTQHSTYNHS